MRSSVTLKSGRFMISMVRMPSRREWEVVEGCTIPLTYSSHSLVVAALLEVCYETKTDAMSLTLRITYIVAHAVCTCAKVVAAVGAEGSGGERMWFIL